MSSGPKLEPTPGVNVASGNPPKAVDLEEFVAWLYASPAIIEVVALENAVVTDVECSVRDESGGFTHENLALDSGTWVLCRISDQPAPDALGSIIVFERDETSGHAAPD